MNRDRNMLDPAFELFCFYNIDCKLTVIIYGSWSTRDLESKVLGWVGDIGHFLCPSRRFEPQSIFNGLQRMVGVFLTNGRQHQKYIG